MKRITTTTVGALIELCYEEFMLQYDDPNLAAIATATVVTDLLGPELFEDETWFEDAA